MPSFTSSAQARSDSRRRSAWMNTCRDARVVDLVAELDEHVDRSIAVGLAPAPETLQHSSRVTPRSLARQRVEEPEPVGVSSALRPSSTPDDVGSIRSSSISIGRRCRRVRGDPGARRRERGQSARPLANGLRGSRPLRCRARGRGPPRSRVRDDDDRRADPLRVARSRSPSTRPAPEAWSSTQARQAARSEDAAGRPAARDPVRLEPAARR